MPAPEFNRNQSAVVAQLAETRGPLYLKRNGKNGSAVMNAESADHAALYKEEIRTTGTGVLRGLIRGYQDALNGKTVEAGEVFD